MSTRGGVGVGFRRGHWLVSLRGGLVNPTTKTKKPKNLKQTRWGGVWRGGGRYDGHTTAAIQIISPPPRPWVFFLVSHHIPLCGGGG